MAHVSELIAGDIKAYLAQHRHKDLLRFITCGSVDDGKSTLIGRLLYDSKMIFEDQLAALEADSRRIGSQGQEIDFAEMVQTGDKFFPCKWHEHAERWLDNPHGAEMITVRYEDLKSNTAAELARIADFAGFKRDLAALEAAARSASFSAMKRRETSFPWENPQVPKNGQFIRRGQVGSHRDEMPADAREAFLREAGPTLKRTGYLP